MMSRYSPSISFLVNAEAQIVISNDKLDDLDVGAPASGESQLFSSPQIISGFYIVCTKRANDFPPLGQIKPELKSFLAELLTQDLIDKARELDNVEFNEAVSEEFMQRSDLESRMTKYLLEMHTR